MARDLRISFATPLQRAVPAKMPQRTVRRDRPFGEMAFGDGSRPAPSVRRGAGYLETGAVRCETVGRAATPHAERRRPSAKPPPAPSRQENGPLFLPPRCSAPRPCQRLVSGAGPSPRDMPNRGRGHATDRRTDRGLIGRAVRHGLIWTYGENEEGTQDDRWRGGVEGDGPGAGAAEGGAGDGGVDGG
jgi:hypothetical protein